MACFQSRGTVPDFSDILKIILSGSRSSSFACCKRWALILSGPGAEFDFNAMIFFLVVLSVMTTFSSFLLVSRSRMGMFEVSSLVNTLVKNLFRFSDISFSSVTSLLSESFSGPIPV